MHNWDFMTFLMNLMNDEPGEGGGTGGEGETQGKEGKAESEAGGDAGVSGEKEGKASEDSGDGGGDGGDSGDAKGAESENQTDYELKLEKDSLLDDNDLKSISEYAKAQKLSEKDAKELLERHEDAIGKHVEKLENDHKAKTASWKKDIEARKEFKEERVLVDQAMEKFGTTELKEALEKSGYSNFAPLWDFVKSIGKAMSDDNFEQGSQARTAKKVEDMSLGEAMYPDMK